MSVPEIPTLVPSPTTPDVSGRGNLEALSRETGVSVEMLRTLAGISDPTNRHLFSAEAAYDAFVGSRPREEAASSK